jgi:diguanylate cyclase (GGDEF)-like protein
MSQIAKPARQERQVTGVRLALRVVSGLIAVAAVAAVAWLGWTGKQMRDEAHAAAQHAVRAAELRGTIAHLDEWTTMSARMAVLSGDRRWADRYEEAVPKLDAAIREASTLASPEVRAALDSTAGEAFRDLVAMERRSLQLAAAGDLPAAQALLDGPEFNYIEDVYQTGIDVFGQGLATLVDARTSDLERRAWLGALAFALTLVLLVTLVLWLRGRMRLKAALERIAEAARIDTLTELPNRRCFLERFEDLLEGPGGGRCALLLVDLDRFKAVNDAQGHAAGDEVLQLAANRVRNHVRDTDLVARVGGDEFGLVYRPDTEGPSPECGGLALAARIASLLAGPFTLRDGSLIQIGASVGVASPDAACRSAGDLMQRGEVAVRQAKADGRGRIRAFRPGMDADFRLRARLERDLRQAIAADAIVPHYQPLVDLRTEAVIGVEMLARWRRGEDGMVSPAEFIPLAEEIGLIGILTENLLRQACREAVRWPGEIVLACNVSALQLRDPDLPETIRGILAETGFPARRLEIEITESALVGDLDLARALLRQLKTLGVSLALDDFGTGYSSLRHLQTLPFDKLKIDQSFVAGLGEDPDSDTIVAAVVGLGHNLGLTTVAEGVELPRVAVALRALGCDVGQGWLFGRPGPAETIPALAGRPTLAGPTTPPVETAA